MEGLDKLYPLDTLDITEKDLQDKFFNAAGPISLFASGNDVDDAAPDLPQGRALTPIEDKLVLIPTSLNGFLQIIRPRIRPHATIEHLTIDDQEGLIAILIGEISNVWPDLQEIAHDPYLEEESNLQLKRRIMINIVVTAEELFHKYFDIAETLNKRGVFSAAANSSRLQAELSIEAHKRFNVLALRRIILADMKNEESNYKQERYISNGQRQEIKSIKNDRKDLKFVDKPINAEVNELKNCMPTIPKQFQRYDELSVLYDLVKKDQDQFETEEVIGDEIVYEREESDKYEDKDQVTIVDSRRYNSLPELNIGSQEDLMSELRINVKEIRMLGPEVYPGSIITRTTSVGQIELDGIYNEHKQGTVQLEDSNPYQIGTREYVAEDLKKLISNQTADISPLMEIQDEDAELPPLLQALVKIYEKKEPISKQEEIEPEVLVTPNIKKDQEEAKTIIRISETASASPQVERVASKTGPIKRKTSVAAALLDINMRSLDARIKSASSHHPEVLESPLLEELPMLRRKSYAGVSEISHGQIDKTVDMGRTFRIQDIITEIEDDEGDDDKKSYTNVTVESSKEEVREVPQPATMQLRIPDGTTVRLTDVRVSNRVTNTSLTMDCFPTIYNDMTGEIDAKTVAWLDRDLFVGEEVKSVYEEVMRSIDRDHLVFDLDDNLEPCTENVKLSDFMISATLRDKPKRRIINPLLYSEKKQYGRQTADMWAKRDKVLLENKFNLKDSLNSNESLKANQNKEARAYASWLASWRAYISAGDYIKYLTQQETDFLSVLFHFYNSDDEDSDDNDGASQPTAEELERLRIREGKLQKALGMKNMFSAGYWNVNSVALGGLGRDPDIDAMDDEEYISLKKPEPIVAEKEIRVPSRRDKKDPANISRSTKALSLQDRLHNIWTALWFPDSQRMDMALKYSADQYKNELEMAIQDWEAATDVILRRESAIARLEGFERTASDPKRFFLKGSKGSSVRRLFEAKQRSILHDLLSDIEPQIIEVVEKIEKNYGDIVTYQGRPYLDKLKSDKTEMLYWLHQERRQKAFDVDTNNRLARGSPNYVRDLLTIDPNALL